MVENNIIISWKYNYLFRAYKKDYLLSGDTIKNNWFFEKYLEYLYVSYCLTRYDHNTSSHVYLW